MKVILAASLGLILAGSAQASDVKAEIDAANAKFVAAFNKGDAAAVAQLYADNATALPPGAAMVKGQAAIQAFWQGAIKGGFKNLTLTALQVDRVGYAAREIGAFSLDVGGPQGKTTHIDGKYVVLWRKSGGTWWLDTDIWNMNQ